MPQTARLSRQAVKLQYRKLTTPEGKEEMALKSKWRRLAAEDVKTVLAQDEIEKLQQISVEGIDDVI